MYISYRGQRVGFGGPEIMFYDRDEVVILNVQDPGIGTPNPIKLQYLVSIP